MSACWQSDAPDNSSPFEAWSRSDYNHTGLVHCQEFLPCPNYDLPGPFLFIFFLQNPLPAFLAALTKTFLLLSNFKRCTWKTSVFLLTGIQLLLPDLTTLSFSHSPVSCGATITTHTTNTRQVTRTASHWTGLTQPTGSFAVKPSLPKSVQFPGWKMQGLACKQCIFQSYNSLLSVVCILMNDENAFSCWYKMGKEKKKKKRRKKRGGGGEGGA